MIDGAVGKLERKYFDEKMTIRFNINGCFPNFTEQQILKTQGHPLKCRPDFEILLEKKGLKMFCNCIYGPGDEFPKEIREQFSEAFDIMAVTVRRIIIFKNINLIKANQLLIVRKFRFFTLRFFSDFLEDILQPEKSKISPTSNLGL